ncbi:MAG TPA: hypothetical protein VL996_05320 [Methylocella sp.]|nr:hypothetical protein [Methylocella sp.]
MERLLSAFLTLLPRTRNEYMSEHMRHSHGQGNREIIKNYWMPLEGSHKIGAWEVLDAGYSEHNRAYHTWDHIAVLFEKLTAFSDLPARTDIIALSIFWHDAVYKTQNQDGSPLPDYENVCDSAELFRQYTLLKPSDADAVHDMIMATANHMQARAEKQYYPGFAGDLDLFLDLDLSSLASSWEEFAEDFAKIRSEFFRVSEIDFCSKQIEILENFAKDEVQLYRRAETREKWREAARTNLKRCIAELTNRLAEISSP